jgi:hypothetical protein
MRGYMLNDSLIKFLAEEIQQAKTEKQAEVIAGNPFKEALWQGELTAYRKLLSFCHAECGTNDYLMLYDKFFIRRPT